MLEICGAAFIIVFGCLAHFLYEWSGHNKFIGYFTAVNESTWEHMKLVLGPSFLWLIMEAHVYHDNPNLLFAKFIGLLVMLVLIPAIFYTYRHFAHKDSLAADIATFVVAVVIGQVAFGWLINSPVNNLLLTHIGAIGLIVIFLYYVTHTYAPGHNFLTRDPITHRYGLRGHSHPKAHQKVASKEHPAASTKSHLAQKSK